MNHSLIVFGTAGRREPQKNALQWKLIYREVSSRPHVKWVMLVTLQTYVIVPNLQTLVSRSHILSHEPFLLGRPMLANGWTYPGASSSAGLLLTRAGLEVFANRTRNFDALLSGGPPSKHFADAGLFVRDSRDEKGRERFLLFSPLGETYAEPKPWAQHHCCWFIDQSFYGFHTGLECCAETAVTFHYIDPLEQHALHYVLHRAAELRQAMGREGGGGQASSGADLTEAIFGQGWPKEPAINQYGNFWRKPRYRLAGGTGRASAQPNYDNALVRELLANQIRMGEDATWNITRLLQRPAWTTPRWRAHFESLFGSGSLGGSPNGPAAR